MFLHTFYPDDAWSHALRDATTAEDARDWMLQLEQEENIAQELLGEHDAIRRFEEHADLGWRFWKHSTYIIIFPTENGFRAGPVR